MAACDGNRQVSVDNSFVGAGATKEAALADLMDRIAEAGEGELKCRAATCPAGCSCEPYVEENDVASHVRYGRARRRWTARFFGPGQGAQNHLVRVYCTCVPQVAEAGDAQFLIASAFAPGMAAGGPRGAPKKLLLGIDDHVPGKRCVEGLVTGTARNVAPVTDPDKAAAERAVLTAGRASAIADAQSKCDAGRCDPKDGECTFVKILEGSSITSTPSRDPAGNIVWTCTLVSFEVLGPCICRVAEDGQKKKPVKKGRR